MNNLLFIALLIALLYYFSYHLPKQKQLISNHNPTTKLEQSKFTKYQPDATVELTSNQYIPYPKVIKNLQKFIAQKEQTIIGLNNSYQKLEQKNTGNLNTLQELQAQIRELDKRPFKPTNSKATQTDSDLQSTIDTLIKVIQALNNEL